MKKFLLSLCVTMLAFVGAWAQGEVQLTPAPAGTVVMDLNDPAKEFSVRSTMVDAIPYNVTTTVVYADTDAPASDILEWAWNGNKTFKITPKALTPSVATLKIKVVGPGYAPWWTTTQYSDPFQLVIDDKTLVKSFTVSDQNVQVGKDNTISVLVSPSTAVFQTPTVADNDANVSVAYANEGGKTNYSKLIVTVPNDATLGSTAKITLTPKEGSPAEAQTFTVTVVKQELPVNEAMPKSTIHVGELCDNMLGIDDSYGLTKDVDYTVSYTAVGTNANGEALVEFDTNGDIHGVHAGVATLTFTFTPTETAAASEYQAWSRSMNVLVVPGETELNLNVTQSVFEQGTGGTATLIYGFSADGYTGVPCTDFTLQFDTEGTATGVTLGTADVDLQKWDIIVGTDAPAEQFALVVKLIPNNPDDYKPATAKAAILVKNSAAKATISVDANGVYTVNIPSPGAFGESQDDPVSNGYAELVGDATLDGLKAAQNIKVTGLLANSDVRELTRLIGKAPDYVPSEHPGDPFRSSLDMGEAQMTEAITTVGYSCSLLESNGNCLSNLKSLVLPRPAVGVENGTVLPANFNKFFTNLYNNGANILESLVIPEGWTETKGGFSSYNGGGASTFGHLTTLKLPNTLAKIGAYSFSGLNVKTLYMPKFIERIDVGAFNVSPSLMDVYFTGHAPSYVHKDAFGGDTQMCNNTVDDTGLAAQGPGPSITRYEYRDEQVLACILHYPKEYKSEYIDETRIYRQIPEDQTYSKGYNIYIPEGWSQSFIDQVKEKVTTATSKSSLSLTQDLGVKDKTYGNAFVWPSQSQMTTGYGIAQAGYLWNTQPMDPATQYNPSATYENGLVDKRGLYQFIVGMGNAPDDPHEWKFKYEQDKWYTISLPFDMTPAQIKKVFGDKTQVCRFSEVKRETPDEGTKVLKLIFKNSVMEEGDGRPEDIIYYYDDLGGISDTPVEKAGIRHHHPYMIKPSGEVDAEDATIKYNPVTGERSFYGYESVPGSLEEETVGGAIDPYYSGMLFYYFRPNMMQAAIKKNSYVLTKDKTTPTIHKFVFYKGKKNSETGLYEDGGTQVANSGYVQLNHGESDLAAFFAETIYTPASKSLFGVDGDDDSATEIEKVVIVCGDDVDEDAKVYTIGGQLVNGNSLPAGLYIKNGKKFIVK